MGFDPDFVVTVDGDDATKYVHNWKLTDSEKKSTLVVEFKNPDQVLSGKYADSKEIGIVFGYVGNMGEQVTMAIKKYEESYSVVEQHDFIKITGMDCLSANGENNNIAAAGSAPPGGLPK